MPKDKKKDMPTTVPVTKCTTKTNTKIVKTRHGVVRVEVKSPVDL